MCARSDVIAGVVMLTGLWIVTPYSQVELTDISGNILSQFLRQKAERLVDAY